MALLHLHICFLNTFVKSSQSAENTTLSSARNAIKHQIFHSDDYHGHVLPIIETQVYD